MHVRTVSKYRLAEAFYVTCLTDISELGVRIRSMLRPSEITAQRTEVPEPVELAYRDAMQESDRRKVIGKINAAIPILRERLQQIDPQPGCEIEKRHLALELQALPCRSAGN